MREVIDKILAFIWVITPILILFNLVSDLIYIDKYR
jgi:hypothetical protein